MPTYTWVGTTYPRSDIAQHKSGWYTIYVGDGVSDFRHGVMDDCYGGYNATIFADLICGLYIGYILGYKRIHTRYIQVI